MSKEVRFPTTDDKLIRDAGEVLARVVAVDMAHRTVTVEWGGTPEQLPIAGEPVKITLGEMWEV